MDNRSEEQLQGAARGDRRRSHAAADYAPGFAACRSSIGSSCSTRAVSLRTARGTRCSPRWPEERSVPDRADRCWQRARLGPHPPRWTPCAFAARSGMRCTYDDSEFMSETSAAAMRGARAGSLDPSGARSRSCSLRSSGRHGRARRGNGRAGPGHSVRARFRSCRTSRAASSPRSSSSPARSCTRASRSCGSTTRVSPPRISRAKRKTTRCAHASRVSKPKRSLKPFVPPPDLQRDKPELVQQEQELFDSRRRDFAAGLAVLQRQAEQRAQELAEMQARDTQLQAQLRPRAAGTRDDTAGRGEGCHLQGRAHPAGAAGERPERRARGRTAPRAAAAGRRARGAAEDGAVRRGVSLGGQP